MKTILVVHHLIVFFCNFFALCYSNELEATDMVLQIEVFGSCTAHL